MLDAWKHDQLADAEALLTAAINRSQNPSHRVLASRALIRARLNKWDTALIDAETVWIALFSHAPMLIPIYTKSIRIRPSVIGYVATSIALVGNGKRDKAYRTCDIAFKRFRSSHYTFLLLIKVWIFRTPLLLRNCSSPLGCRRLYGRRAPRGNIASRRPNC